MSHADVKNVKITKSVLSLTKFDQILAICSGYLCDFMRFFFFVKVCPSACGELARAYHQRAQWSLRQLPWCSFRKLAQACSDRSRQARCELANVAHCPIATSYLFQIAISSQSCRNLVGSLH